MKQDDFDDRAFNEVSQQCDSILALRQSDAKLPFEGM